jgi:secretion/DNA translocation related CpaE-like protein
MSAATALVVTRDDALVDHVLRLAAAAGVSPQVAVDVSAALRAWSTASLVLVGVDELTDVVAAEPVRRAGVHVVVAGDPPPPEAFRLALALGAEDVVELPAAATWLVDRLTDMSDGVAGPALTLAVVGGCGGAGASTFAAALAATAARSGRSVLVVDADGVGAGIDRILGLEEESGVRWDSLTAGAGRFSARSFRAALPQRDGLAVLTWGSSDRPPLEPSTVREVLSAARRGNDVVVVDLPRHPGPVSVEVLARCDDVLLLTCLTVSSVAASGRVAAHLREHSQRLHLVTRGRRSALAPADVGRALGIGVVAEMQDQRRLGEAVDLGLGPLHARRGPLARASAAVLTQLATERPSRP